MSHIVFIFSSILNNLASPRNTLCRYKPTIVTIDEGLRQKKGQRTSLLFGGKYLFNSLPRQLIALDDFEEQDEFIPLKKSSWCNSSYNSNRPVQNSQRGKELNTFFPPNRSNNLCLFLCLYPSSLLVTYLVHILLHLK